MDGDNGRLLKNAWYVCAWDDEIGPEPLQRWICGEPIVFWRRRDGSPAALADRCPHRDAPLSLGRVVGDDIRCGYHGLVFDASGRCVAVPGGDRVPEGARTRSYPVIERWGWAFVWTGDPARADPALLPDYHWKGDPAWVGKGETLHVRAHYGLLRDNLLDLTHAHYVHRQTLATDGVLEFPIETDFDGERLSVVRDMRGIAPSPFFARIGGFTGSVDHRQEILYTPPGNIVIKLRVAGAAREGNRAVGMRVLNALKLPRGRRGEGRCGQPDDRSAPRPARPIRWSVDKGVHRWIDALTPELRPRRRTQAVGTFWSVACGCAM